jgi:hypothetical protein
MPLYAGKPVCHETVAEVEVRLDTTTDVMPRPPVEAAPAVRFTTAVPDTVGVCVLVAVMIALPDAGTVVGAVKTPDAEIFPTLELQVTAEL